MLKVICRECNKEYPVTNKFCPYCGHSKEIFACSKCGKKYGVNSKNYKHCKKCGGEIVPEREKPKAEPTKVMIGPPKVEERPNVAPKQPESTAENEKQSTEELEKEKTAFFRYHERHVYGWRIFAGVVCFLSGVANFVSISSLSEDLAGLAAFCGLLGFCQLITGIFFFSSVTSTKKCSIALIVYAAISLVFGFISLNPAHFAGSIFHIFIGAYLIKAYGRIEKQFNDEYYE